MKRIIRLLPVAAVLFMGLLSCDEKDSLKEEKQSGPKIETLSADKVTFMVATLSGRVSGLEDIALDYECGIEYSTDESFSDEYSIRQKDDKKYTEDSYSITVSGIQPGKKYYYRAYYINQLLIYYGDVKTFTFEWTAPDVTTLSAELNESSGVVILKGLIKDKGAFVEELSKYYPNDYYGIECSTTDAFEVNSTTYLYPNRDNDNMENDSIICSLTQFKYSTIYYYRTFFRLGEIQNLGQVKSFKFEWDSPKMVDLGLSVKWASCNVGATYPWDYGEHYAWGETASKSNYSWSTYKYCNGSSNKMTKYCNNSHYGNYDFTDTKTTLDPEDDVAHVAWGGSWRMPTIDEFTELRNNCTWTWTTQNGVNGYLVTSNKSDYTDRSIFLPAAGYCNDSRRSRFGSDGNYWSSSLDTDTPSCAWNLIFDSTGRVTRYDARLIGLSVRPVCP